MTAQPGAEHYDLGVKDVLKGEYIAAAREFALVKQTNPTLKGVDKQLGLAWFHSKAYQNAIPALQQARKQQPDDMQVLLALGTSLSRTGKVDAAQSVFADLLQRHQNSAELYLLWGQVYASVAQTANAETEFKEAVRLDPKLKGGHSNLGLLFLKEGRLPEATAEFRAELVAYPADTTTRYDLGVALLHSNEPMAGLAELKRVLAADPDNAGANYEYGKSQLAAGDVPAAITHLKNAARHDANKSYIHYQLGRAYQAAGRMQEAEKEFAKVKALRGISTN